MDYNTGTAGDQAGPTQPEATMIEAKAISKDYGATRALHDVSFTIADHEIVGLLGPNGAGKTTLMKILTGYLQPTDGTAKIAGIDVVEDPLAVQAKIGYLPENAPLYPDMLVQEYLAMMAELRETPEAERPGLISEAVRRTALEAYLARPIGELSKGYRQRVGMAQAILHRPQVLILDEPTSGLDPNQIVEIRRLIRKLAKRATVLLSTHILSEVELTCERVLIIRDGKLGTDARLEELRTGEGAVCAVASEAAGVDEALRKLEGVREVEQRGIGEGEGFTRWRVLGERGSSGAALCPRIFDLCKERGWRLAELRPEGRTLEALFREIEGGVA
jgi:ABC-2 type transport system ATP-binding protein